MKLIARLTLVLIIMLLAAFPAMASTLTDATYNGTLRVTNSSDAASSVAAAFPLNAQNLIDAGYMASDFSNIAITYGGADMVFMPGHGENPWMVYVPSIAQNGILDYKLCTGGSTPMGGKMAYFPGDAGLTTNDAAALELGGNFEIEVQGCLVHPSPASGSNDRSYLINKANAIGVEVLSDGTLLYFTGADSDTGESLLNQKHCSQSITPAVTVTINGIYLKIAKSGTPPATLDYGLYLAADGMPTGSALSTGSVLAADISTVADWRYCPLSSISLTGGTQYCIVLSMTGTAGNTYKWSIQKSDGYPGGYLAGSTNGTTWSPTSNYDASFMVAGQASCRGTYRTAVLPPASVDTVYTFGNDGSYNYVKLDNDDSWDGINSNRVACAVAVTDNSSNYLCITGGAMAYMDYLKLTINGTLQQHLVYQYAETPVVDISGQNNQPDSVSVRTTSSDADVSASLISFTPINESIASDIGVGGTSSSPIATTPTQPDNMYEDPDGTSEIKLPGAAVINDLLDASNTPYAFFWLPVIGAIIIFASYFTYKYAPSLLVKAAANWVLFIFFAAVGVFGFWTFVLFFICSWTMIVHSRSYGL